ncbi:hypothetical protein [uncultured Eubacterium sp.]|uniref:DUF3846 domain-containing protein n=1 Tax=uncultured Eubacterium sp. TaxID=165185 RepID=UPI0025DA3110|nr:hypothetical protein [uncultured Eubacterium sp.]
MKKFKGNKIFILLLAAVIIALAVFAILKSRSSDNKKTEIVSKTTTEAVEVSDDIFIKDNPTEKVENTEKMSKKVIKPEEPIDVIVGTAFICDCSGEEFGSLSDEQIKKYTKELMYPEKFYFNGNEIVGKKFNPNNREHER